MSNNYSEVDKKKRGLDREVKELTDSLQQLQVGNFIFLNGKYEEGASMLIKYQPVY